ncbi:MAG: acyl-CoA dehydrogenase family protein [Thermoleophilia bacterium]|nr:acyl-CoA dehydrogenase family protein [Thermoleophilia bacterium]
MAATATITATDWLEKAKHLAKTELVELGDELERADEMSDEVWQRLTDTGLLRLTLKKEYGGEGLSESDYFPILEVCAQPQGAIRMLIHGANGLWRILDQYGSEEMKRAYLPPLAHGAYNVFVITEPEAGSGRDMKTTARQTKDGWVLNGQKHWATHADRAQVFYIIAKSVDEDGGDLGFSAYLVEPDRQGLTMEHMAPTMGCRGVRHDLLTFADCWIPTENVIGRVGQGLDIAFRGFLDLSRLSIANCCVGVAQAALEEAVAFARERVTFGKPIASRQYIQGRLAEAATDVHAGRLMVQDAARKYDAGQTITREAAMAKFFCLEMGGRVTDHAIRTLGGLGYTTDYKVERYYRDIRGMWFEEGTAEIQKTVIGRDVVERGW